ncbi:MAG: nucleotidyltransferase family protein [Firmicutes bacterium]|nr:nucleotidyltransferase family protein [Bacillota bacterium]
MTRKMTVDALILAGTEETPLTQLAGVANKALLPIGGKPMIAYVREAIAALPEVQRIAVIGPQQLQQVLDAGQIPLFAEQGSVIDNFLYGCAQLGTADRVLAVTADIPMLTPQALQDFLHQCAAYEADIYYPIIPKEATEKAYPGVTRTYLKLKDGVFTGGNLFLLRPTTIAANAEAIRHFFELRKHPLRIASQLGWGLFVRVLLSQVWGIVSVRELEEHIGHLFHLQGKAIVSQYPEIGTDVDKSSDWKLVEEILAGRRAS